MLALGAVNVGAPEDHEAGLGLGEVVSILACRVLLAGCLLLAPTLLHLAGLP